ncbi:MAG TPA: hypothetical protein VMT46_19640, partial [Anaerolineaceae bacterium]|nr:hypothetical protein [Anaerolineaceae bacterium]
MSLKPELLQEILSHYRLSPWGIHGLAHWARVLENGRRLQAQTGARLDVVELFAVFHDSQRRNDGIDIGHGGRGASLAMALQGAGYEIDNAGLYLLAAACKGHTSGRGSDDITVWTCWDADRLDIGRVGWKPNPKYLFTAPAKT